MPESSSSHSTTPIRRILISEQGITDAPLSFGGLSPLPEAPPTRAPQKIEDRKGEIRRIVKRLLAIIEDHRLAALRIQYTIDAQALDLTLRALEAETRNEDPTPILAQGGEIGSYILTALYQELLDEPSNILHTTHITADVVRYEAMEAPFWKECLAALRTTLTP